MVGGEASRRHFVLVDLCAGVIGFAAELVAGARERQRLNTEKCGRGTEGTERLATGESARGRDYG